MKLKIQQEEKKFEPMKLELTLETIEEARLMWHILNRDGLREVIFSGGYMAGCNLNNVANQFSYVFQARNVFDQAFKAEGYTL